MASLAIGFMEGAQIPMTVYEMRTYTVQVGKMPEAIRLYSQFGYPALHKGGFDKKLVGYFISDTGTLHQLVHLWKFDDDADRRAHWAALFADKDFIDGFAAQFRPLVQTQEVKLLTAAPGTPSRRRGRAIARRLSRVECGEGAACPLDHETPRTRVAILTARWGHARRQERVAHRGTAHVQTTRRPSPQWEPGMTQPQNLFIPADAGEKVTLPGIAITIKVTAASDRQRLCRLRGSHQSWSRTSAPCASPSVRNFSLSGGRMQSRWVTRSLPPSRARWPSSRPARPMPSAHGRAGPTRGNNLTLSLWVHP